MRRLLRLTVVTLSALAVPAIVTATVGGSPAGAIETSSFGIAADERLGGSEDGRVDVPVEPGKRSEVHLRVWNKTDAPLALTLQPAAASLDDDGRPQLGGDAEPVSWVSLDTTEVTLGPRRQRIVTMTVSPSETFDGRQTVAVLAAPAAVAADAAVLERVGVVVHMHTGELLDDGSPSGLSGASVPILVAVLGVTALGGAATGIYRMRDRVDDLPLGPPRH